MENQNQEQVQNQNPEVSNLQSPNAPREIRLSELSAYVQEGKKKEDLMEIYGLNSAQVVKLMKSAGLEFRRFRKPAFVLIKDMPMSTGTTNLADPSPSITQETPQEVDASNTPRVEEEPKENLEVPPTPESSENINPSANQDVQGEDWI